MSKKTDLPAMPFYVGDWLKCPEVRALQPDARGLWFDLICYLWESTERGVMVKPNGKPYTENEIIRIVGLDNQNSGSWLTSLLDNCVCSVRKSDGAIFSRRMVRDEQIRSIRRESGKKGGNPTLLLNHEDNYLVNQNGNQITEDENENINESSSGEKSVRKEPEYSFVPEGWLPTWLRWLQYRKEIGKSFKSKKSLEANFNHLQNLSSDNLEIAEKIIEQTIVNGYQGLFELKLQNNATNKNIRSGAGSGQSEGQRNATTLAEYSAAGRAKTGQPLECEDDILDPEQYFASLEKQSAGIQNDQT